jgi:nucleotide-binding universal stress UspA family protein
MRIVVGYDGSDPAKRALQRAADLAADGDKIVVVASAEAHVSSGARSGIMGGAHSDPSEFQQRGDHLEEAKQLLSDRGLDIEALEAHGDPGTAIVEAAKDTDLIIVGSRGLNPVQRILLGSVSSKVVHRAPCDVLVVR